MALQRIRTASWAWLACLGLVPAGTSAQLLNANLSPDAVRLADTMQYVERAREELRLGLQQAIDAKRAPAKDMECLKAVDFTALRDMYAEVFTAYLEKESATVIALFTSAPGKQLLRRWQADELSFKGLPYKAPGDPTKEEQEVLSQLRTGLAGRLLTPGDDIEVQDDLRLKARQTIARLVAPCDFAVPVQFTAGALRLVDAMQLAEHTRELYEKAAQRAVDDGQASAKDMACLKSVDFSPLRQVYAEVFTEKLSKQEIATAIDFFGSPPGKLYVRDVQARNLRDFGYSAEGPGGQASAQDRALYEKFAFSPAGMKLIDEEVHERPTVRAEVSRVATQLTARCALKE